MQGIYKYIPDTNHVPRECSVSCILLLLFMVSISLVPETNHVPREYNVSAILSLLFMLSISLVPALALLYFYVSTFRSMCTVYYYYYYYYYYY